MSQPVYCQGDRNRKSTSLLQFSPDALASQIGWQLLPCNPPFGIVTDLISVSWLVVASWHPTGATLAEGWSGALCNPAQWSHSKKTDFVALKSVRIPFPMDFESGSNTIGYKKVQQTCSRSIQCCFLVSDSVQLFYWLPYCLHIQLASSPILRSVSYFYCLNRPDRANLIFLVCFIA